MSDTEDGYVRVGVRVRPLGAGRGTSRSKLKIDPAESKMCVLSDDEDQVDDKKAREHNFQFGAVFEGENNQGLFEEVGAPLVSWTLQGYNATLFAYGQTGSGKTYTMGEISKLGTADEGIGHRIVHRLFHEAEASHASYSFSIEFVQIYVEKIYDLLKDQEKPSSTGVGATPKNKPEALTLYAGKNGIRIQGVQSMVVETAEECIATIKRGARNLAFASTQMNHHSSRSHAVCRIIVESHDMPVSEEEIKQRVPSNPHKPTIDMRLGHHDGVNPCIASWRQETKDELIGQMQTMAKLVQNTRGVLTLCDLAGSEDVGRSGASGQALAEAKKINTSLLALGNVIHSLAHHGRSSQHVPFRDSVLTRILQESLGGNAKTSMIACVSPSDADITETLSTLRFAARAAKVKNHARINATISSDVLTGGHHVIETLAENLQQQLEAALKRLEVARLKNRNQASRLLGTVTRLKLEERKAALASKQAGKQEASLKAAIEAQRRSLEAEHSVEMQRMDNATKQQAEAWALEKDALEAQKVNAERKALEEINRLKEVHAEQKRSLEAAHHAALEKANEVARQRAEQAAKEKAAMEALHAQAEQGHYEQLEALRKKIEQADAQAAAAAVKAAKDIAAVDEKRISAERAAREETDRMREEHAVQLHDRVSAFTNDLDQMRAEHAALLKEQLVKEREAAEERAERRLRTEIQSATWAHEAELKGATAKAIEAQERAVQQAIAEAERSVHEELASIHELNIANAVEEAVRKATADAHVEAKKELAEALASAAQEAAIEREKALGDLIQQLMDERTDALSKINAHTLAQSAVEAALGVAEERAQSLEARVKQAEQAEAQATAAAGAMAAEVKARMEAEISELKARAEAEALEARQAKAQAALAESNAVEAAAALAEAQAKVRDLEVKEAKAKAIAADAEGGRLLASEESDEVRAALKTVQTELDELKAKLTETTTERDHLIEERRKRAEEAGSFEARVEAATVAKVSAQWRASIEEFTTRQAAKEVEAQKRHSAVLAEAQAAASKREAALMEQINAMHAEAKAQVEASKAEANASHAVATEMFNAELALSQQRELVTRQELETLAASHEASVAAIEERNRRAAAGYESAAVEAEKAALALNAARETELARAQRESEMMKQEMANKEHEMQMMAASHAYSLANVEESAAHAVAQYEMLARQATAHAASAASDVEAIGASMVYPHIRPHPPYQHLGMSPRLAHFNSPFLRTPLHVASPSMTAYTANHHSLDPRKVPVTPPSKGSSTERSS